MLGKDWIRDTLLQELDICVHLYGKIPEGGLDYRPTPAQRSTLELLRYLASCVTGGIRFCVDGDWEGYKAETARVAEMPAEDFPAAVERAKGLVVEWLDALDQEAIETGRATTPLGEELSIEEALALIPVKWAVAYRMQLFLYAKQAGNEDIWTPNCWGGVDYERPKPAEVP